MQIRGAHHIVFLTRDLDAMVRFYNGVLGLDVVKAYETFDVPVWIEDGRTVHDGGDLQAPRHYFFDLGNETFLAFFDQGKDASRVPEDFVRMPGAFHHLSLRVDSEDELEAAHRELQEAGVAVGSIVLDHEYCKSIYFQDPEGRNLEMSCDVRAFRGLDDLDDPDPVPALIEIKRALAAEAP